MLPKINPTTTQAWKKLGKHYEKIKDTHMKTWFETNPGRGSDFQLELNGLYLDYSKNRLDAETLHLLAELAEECRLK